MSVFQIAPTPAKTPRLVISHSEADSEVLCQLRHYYAFGEKLQKKTQSVSLSRGIIGHHLMHVFFQTLKDTRNWDAALTALDLALAEAMKDKSLNAEKIKTLFYLQRTIHGFLNFYRERIEAWEILHVEQTFFLDCGDFDYAFQCDVIVLERGRLRIIDWKFIYDFYHDSMVDLAPQIPRYMGALRALVHPVSGGYYGFLRYREVKREGENNRFLLRPVNPSDKRIQNSFLDLIKAVTPIAEKRQLTLSEWHDSVRRTSNQLVCKHCAFIELCVEELNGGDGKLTRQIAYEPSTYGYDNTEGE